MDHLYIVSYDVRNPRRWKRLFQTMHGFGDWLQLSVFQCRLDKIRKLRLEASIREIVNSREDHVLIMDLGPADSVTPKVSSIGKVFDPVKKESTIV
ncbi:CRISPR-associated endonuclease Cas2 [Desulforhabdus sp. TSK]|uniref:CRISPR-associated endonuclease Cas2 n=1 Tax=Desulforhabdus sp. TSK TaxID=2925014 RepID=UPI001FC81C24|nr:CRISPR-associated endonuclease Cas2 [Desulforhabdus sp. TSK]GKT07588.1 CRISPR-associated endoribonuclease Cas2 [Desulforhabdus sp. TSK]